MPAMRVCVSGAHCSFWRSKKFLFLVAWPRGSHFWREPKIISRYYRRCLLSWQVLSQQREMRIYWWLCNNSEIHLWLWKVWCLIVCPQTYFYNTRAHEDNKNGESTFFLAKKRWTWYSTSNYYLMSHFNQSNIERKNCVWTTRYERLSEMCIVQHVETKSVFTFQLIKKLVFTTVKSAKHAATFWILRLRTKNGQLCCLVVTVHIVLQEGRVMTTKKKSPLHFWRSFSANHNQAHTNLNEKRTNRVQIWNKRIRFLLADDLSHILYFYIILFNFNLHSTSQLYSTYIQYTESHDLLSLQRRNPVDSRFCSRLCYYCSEWSRPKFNIQLIRKTPSCLAIALVSKTRLFEQSSSASANHNQPRGNNGDERRSTL